MDFRRRTAAAERARVQAQRVNKVHKADFKHTWIVKALVSAAAHHRIRAQHLDISQQRSYFVFSTSSCVVQSWADRANSRPRLTSTDTGPWYRGKEEISRSGSTAYSQAHRVALALVGLLFE